MIKKHHNFMWDFSKSLILSLRRPVFVYLFTLSFTSQLVFALAFFIFESEKNRSVQTFFDSFYYTVTIMTGVGLGDIYPETVIGKLISIGMMLMGTAIFVCFTGVLTASILEIESAKKFGK